MKNQIKTYIKNFTDSFLINDEITEEVIKSVNIIKKLKNNNNKILIFGNGGSQSIASHFQTDMINRNQIRCLNFSGSSILTCFSNDYGYENAFQKLIEIFVDREDMVILISSSGNSINMINAYKKAYDIGCNVLTLSGFDKNNELNKISKNKIWIDSNHYNNIENTHQFILLLISDMISE